MTAYRKALLHTYTWVAISILFATSSLFAQNSDLSDLEARLQKAKEAEVAKRAETAKRERAAAIESASKGTLLVESIEACELSLDGERIGGIKPEAVKRVTAGRGDHLIQCRTEDGILLRQEVKITAGEQSIVRLEPRIDAKSPMNGDYLSPEQTERYSYMVGYDVAMGLKTIAGRIDGGAFMAGLDDGYGNRAVISKDTLTDWRQQFMELLKSTPNDASTWNEVEWRSPGRLDITESSGSRIRFGYMVGVDVGNGLRQIEELVNISTIRRATLDTLAGKSGISDVQAKKEREEFRSIVKTRNDSKHAVSAVESAEEWKAFFRNNSRRAGVKTTESGLQYEIASQGSGNKPGPESTVTVHYIGTKIDGTKFDSSYDRGQPATFKLNEVIKGWTEGLQLMTTGSKYKFYIPPELAYGANGPGIIGPDAALIFEVELLEIGKP